MKPNPVPCSLYPVPLAREPRGIAEADTVERRAVSATVELREASADEKAAGFIGVLVGEIPYNSDSTLLSMRGRAKRFVERMAPEVFKRSLAEDKDIMGFAGHTDDPLAAFARIGENLTFTETKTGLSYRALLPDTQAGRDLKTLAQRKIIRGTSFEFEVRGEAGQKWEKRDDQTDLRTITDARLIAVNPVAWPAYPDSELTVSLRRREQANRADEADHRGTYFKPEAGGVCDWYDPTVTADTKFAGNALHRATYALTDAQEYLRAVAAGGITGALADYAKAEVAGAAANAKTLIDWIAANGAEVNPAALKRAEEKLNEARAAVPPVAASAERVDPAARAAAVPPPASGLPPPSSSPSLTHPDHDRERRFRILTLSSR